MPPKPKPAPKPAPKKKGTLMPRGWVARGVGARRKK